MSGWRGSLRGVHWCSVGTGVFSRHSWRAPRLPDGLPMAPSSACAHWSTLLCGELWGFAPSLSVQACAWRPGLWGTKQGGADGRPGVLGERRGQEAVLGSMPLLRAIGTWFRRWGEGPGG